MITVNGIIDYYRLSFLIYYQNTPCPMLIKLKVAFTTSGFIDMMMCNVFYVRR